LGRGDFEKDNFPTLSEKYQKETKIIAQCDKQWFYHFEAEKQLTKSLEGSLPLGPEASVVDTQLLVPD
jgi:hypothetical protein